MNKTLIIGADLSLNSTGLTTFYCENDSKIDEINFSRIIYGMEFEFFKNVNNFNYVMPKNISVEDLTLDFSDDSDAFKISATLRTLIASKSIFKRIKQLIDFYTPNCISLSIENYIMPNFGGKSNLVNVSSLISLQNEIRSKYIYYCLELKSKKPELIIKLNTPQPSTLKKFFTGYGSFEKDSKTPMLESFLENFNGEALIPASRNIKNLKDLNDVIDSFALALYNYSKLFKNKKP